MAKENFPRSGEHQHERDMLAHSLRDIRRERDSIRRIEDPNSQAVFTDSFGYEYTSEEVADNLQAEAQVVLRRGEQSLKRFKEMDRFNKLVSEVRPLIQEIERAREAGGEVDDKVVRVEEVILANWDTIKRVSALKSGFKQVSDFLQQVCELGAMAKLKPILRQLVDIHSPRKSYVSGADVSTKGEISV